MDKHFDKTSNYKDHKLNFDDFRSEKYFFGSAESSQKIKSLCPDCLIDLSDYKIAGIGNLDEDHTFDIVVINQEGIITVISDDLKEDK